MAPKIGVGPNVELDGPRCHGLVDTLATALDAGWTTGSRGSTGRWMPDRRPAAPVTGALHFAVDRIGVPTWDLARVHSDSLTWPI
jgi:hypothetical protein